MSLQIMLELHGIHDLAKNGVLGVKMLSSDPRKTWEFLHWGNKEEKVPYCFKYQIGKNVQTHFGETYQYCTLLFLPGVIFILVHLQRVFALSGICPNKVVLRSLGGGKNVSNIRFFKFFFTLKGQLMSKLSAKYEVN